MQNLNEISKVRMDIDYIKACSEETYQTKLQEMSKEELIKLLEFTDFQRFTDPNYSQAAEAVTMRSAGMTPHDWREKHGLDSLEENGEGKPTKISKEGNKKFGGTFSFADMSLNKINQLYNNNTSIIHAGFVESKLIYSISIPMQSDLIRDSLIDQFQKKDRAGTRKVLSVSRDKYENDNRVTLNYITDNLGYYEDRFTKPMYEFLLNLLDRTES